MNKQVLLAADAVVIKNNKILLIKRKYDPFKDCWALPGGLVDYGETTENAVLRELKEETDLTGKIKSMIGVYSDPTRDPRGQVVSIAYLIGETKGHLRKKEETTAIRWFSLKKLPKLAFDHAKIIQDAMSRTYASSWDWDSVFVPKDSITKKLIEKYGKDKRVIFVSQAAVNMCWARLICKFVIEKGHAPVNYFTAFGHFVHELADQQTMIDSINSLIVRCDELWAFGEISEGMWFEIKMCKELGIPVRYFNIEYLPKSIKPINEKQVKYLRKFQKKIAKYKKYVPIEKLRIQNQ
ncbi:MAG: NUDIX hydrolase [Candidatus Dojkabacteria bacterium]|nr:NUDIX hydrolase [Candidatus Dojkabacteria bacterium]